MHSSHGPLQSSQSAGKVQRTNLEIAACVFAVTGSCLAIAGALAPWFVVAPGSVGQVSVGLLQTCTSQPATLAVICAANNSPGALAGAACLLLGFSASSPLQRCQPVEAAALTLSSLSQLSPPGSLWFF